MSQDPNEFQFKYRDFHDIPHQLMISVGDRLMLLSSEFDEVKDDYTDHYVIKLSGELPREVVDTIENIRDSGPSNDAWGHFASLWPVLGTVSMAEMEFDRSVRKSIVSPKLREILDQALRS